MYQELFSQFTDVNKNFIKPFNQLNSLTTRVAENMTRQQIAAANDLLGLSIKHAQNLASTKKIEDVIGLNSNFFTETSSKYVEYLNQLFESSIKASTEYSKLFEESMRGGLAMAEEAGRKGKAA